MLDGGRQTLESEFVKVMPIDYKRVLEETRERTAGASKNGQWDRAVAQPV
ncbi:MAG: hypothetical protein CM1200mP20_02940 [Pseudomonadota bacterium]|nr:MAG: hypothetical protein CM1200mP20_02940 [Pseudomonadota bacterium]